MVSIAAVGDISFEGALKNKPSPDVFSEFQKLFRNKDLCIANLECPLTLSTESSPDKCTLSGNPGWANILKDTGFNLVSLANNHIMDYGPQGLHDTLGALDACGIRYVGAGLNYDAASAPLIMDIKGLRIAALGRSMVQVSSPSYAGADTPGVAFFDEMETCETICSCKKECDIVLVLIHWGIEDYFYPSPQQRAIARKLVSSGATAILGHHPHVIQGYEKLGNSLVSYSLGNFFFDDIEWQMELPSGETATILTRLTQDNLIGGYIETKIDRQGLVDFSMNSVSIQKGILVKPYLPAKTFNIENLCRYFSIACYKQAWQLYSIIMEFKLRVLPFFKGKFKFSKLLKIRPHHFKSLFVTIIRSKRIAAGKSTNPYE